MDKFKVGMKCKVVEGDERYIHFLYENEIVEVTSIDEDLIQVISVEGLVQKLHISQLEPIEDKKEVDLEYLTGVYQGMKDNYDKVVGAYPVKIDKESFLSGILIFMRTLEKLQQK